MGTELFGVSETALEYVDTEIIVPMMGMSNLTMTEANDGLVPVSSAALPGATIVSMNPAGDHAAPVMDATPFKNFWSPAHRNDVTSDLVDQLQDKAFSVV